jgi:hypothetical protein
VKQGRCTLVQSDMLLLGIAGVAFDGVVVVVVAVAALARQCGLERGDGAGNLLDRDDALRRRGLADDVEQLARMDFEHHEIRSGPGLETIEHGLFTHL